MTGWIRVCTLAVFTALVCGMGVARAQRNATPPSGAESSPSTASVPPVETLFADASAKESAVRQALADPARQPTVIKAVRTVVADYENVVRHYPTSSYCDDALWRAGRLSRDAFELFRDPRERSAALRLLQQLTSQYPTSKLARLAPEQIAWLNGHAAAPQTTVPGAASAEQKRAGSARPPVVSPPAPAAAAPATRPPGRPTASPAPQTLMTVKAVRRAVLNDVVRVVIELDGEVPFHDQRIENPSRVFVDLPATRTGPGLTDQTMRFDTDVDAVRQIRVGRQPSETTRIVLDATGVSSYSVYPLYNPFRIVIDCVRAQTAAPQRAASVPRHPPAPALRPPAVAVLRSKSSTQTMALPGDSSSRIEADAAPAILGSVSAHWPAALPSGAAVMLAAAGDEATSSTSPLPAWARPDTVKQPTPPTPPAMSAAAAAGAPKPDSRGLSMARQLGLGVSRIVIDPGHGGHDPGAQAEGINEADLVLDIALRLEKLLRKVPGVAVVLTRRENEFVPLQERTAIANRENADVFLSIHANANSAASARGIETYFLNFATNQGAAAVAARENATSDQTMGSLQDVVKAIALSSKVDESHNFASYVQREMVESLRPADHTVKDLGVKQAPFVVLVGASMPSVLAEISFITNPQDARLLKTPAFRQRIAQALFDALRKYQQSLKQGSSIAQQQD
jgi:N-acetylmuramoyl-L-alanine amidase